jgi:hypothetical protein
MQLIYRQRFLDRHKVIKHPSLKVMHSVHTAPPRRGFFYASKYRNLLHFVCSYAVGRGAQKVTVRSQGAVIGYGRRSDHLLGNLA